MTNLEFESTISGLQQELPGKSAISAVNLKTGERYMSNGDEVFPAASIIKLPVLCTAYHLAEKGELSLNSRIPVSAASRYGGNGVLQFMDDGLSPTICDLMTLMIILSDNMATNMVADAVTAAKIHEFCAEKGLFGLKWNRRMMDTEAMAAGIENEITANSVTALLEGLAAGTLLDASHCRDAVEMLQNQQVNHKFPRFLWAPYDNDFGTSDIKIAHKTGDMPGLEHDAGIFSGPDFTFVLTVLTVGERTGAQSLKQWDFIGEVARQFVNYWGPQSRT